MKKQLIITAAVILVIAIACFASGNYYLINNTSDEKIISLELPPFSEDISLCEGETAYRKYFEVFYENGFSVKDIDFVSEDESVAQVEYKLTDRNRYVCYNVTAKGAGETYIYFSADGGKIISDKIKVTVLPPVVASSEQTTESTTTSETVNEAESETTTQPKTEQSSGENTSRTVYVAPTGKRYHYSKSCAGKNGYAVDIDEAIESGKTACKKCAGG